MKRFTVDLEDELYRRLKFYCVERDLRMVEVIRKQLEELLEKADKKKSKS
jgi:hypothetical protein